MSKNTTIWVIIEFFCYSLIFYLVPDLINSINEGSKQNSASIIAQITLIAEIEPNTIYQIEQEAREQRLQQLREQQQQLRESQRQRYEQQQQEWNDQQQQWRDKQREQQQEYREMRRQQQEQERIRQRNELIRLRR